MSYKRKYTLDKNQRYSKIRGRDTRKKFQQDGRYFDINGVYLGDNPNRVKRQAELAPVVEKAPEPPKLTPEQERAKALQAAADKLGGGGVLQSQRDASKENAQALAAEENAA